MTIQSIMKGETKTITPAQAQVRLEELCVKAERSTGELRDKLTRWGIVGAEAAKIIEKLQQNKFVDDARFARAYTREKVKLSRWGRRKIQQGLYQKKVSRENIQAALSEIDTEEYTDNLYTLLRLKIKNAPTLLESYEGRTKIYRFILSRGYEPSLAAETLRDIIKTVND